MADLEILDREDFSNTPQPMPIVHPKTFEPIVDDAGQPMVLALLGDDSDVWKRIERSQRNGSIQRANRGGRNGGNAITAEQMDEQEMKRTIACTVDWHIQLGGQILEHSPQNVRMIYERLPSVYDDARAFIASRANFLGSSPTISVTSPALPSGQPNDSHDQSAKRETKALSPILPSPPEVSSGQTMNGEQAPPIQTQ